MKKKNNAGKKWFFALAIMIILLMVGSTLMIGLNRNESNQLKYNNHRFTFKNNQWITTINNFEFSFNYHPTEVEYLKITEPENMNSPLIYITFDPNETNEYLELGRLKLDLANQLTDTFFSQAIIKPSEKYNLPIITCQNATPYVPVIFYQKSNETKITNKQNCYILQAQTNSDFLKLTERIIYQNLGVING